MGLYLIAETSWWLTPGNWLAIAKTAIGLGFVIFVHELGHFLVAKMCGVKCEKFYVGFDVPIKIGPFRLPSALWRKQWGETEYGIGIIPLGGYVKMLGQDDNPANAAKEAERIRVSREGGGAAVESMELDPRSYPAKSVPQRMAIISAGVIMNLIFAVIFGSVAYLMGVKYVPTMIGGTLPGDPAWEAGLRPGDRLVQLGRDQRYDEQLSFTRDLRYRVIATGANNDFEVRVRHSEGPEEWLTMQPHISSTDSPGLPSIGVLAASKPEIRERNDLLGHPSPASEAGFEDGDLITQFVIDGKKLAVTDAFAMKRLLLLHPDKDITVIVQRPPKDDSPHTTTHELRLAPHPLRRLGLRMKMGPVVAIQRKSPAEAAGFELGDVIETIDGQPVTDPVLLDDLLRPLIGQETTVSVRRPRAGSGSEEVALQLTPRAPEMYGFVRAKGCPMSAEALGLAYEVQDVVDSIMAETPAADSDLRPGDEIVKVQLIPAADDAELREKLRAYRLADPIDFEPGENGWAWFFQQIQTLPEDVQIELTVRRGTAVQKVSIQPVSVPSQFNPERGLTLASMSETRTAGSFGEAWQLGLRETKDGIMQVLFTLRRFKDLFRSLGGPLTIAVVATSEASEGIPRLLVFLTLLSANLAVLNFLPIPVLDGGHMMFLIYEGIIGKPVNERVAFGLTMLGLSFILCLMVFVFGMDVYRFAGFAG